MFWVFMCMRVRLPTTNLQRVPGCHHLPLLMAVQRGACDCILYFFAILHTNSYAVQTNRAELSLYYFAASMYTGFHAYMEPCTQQKYQTKETLMNGQGDRLTAR